MGHLMLNCVIVQEMFFSKHAYRKYRLAPQRRPIGTIDISDINSLAQFRRYWKEYVGRDGVFSLQVRNQDRIGKCIGIIRVGGNGLEFKDKRCTLANILWRRQREASELSRI